MRGKFRWFKLFCWFSEHYLFDSVFFFRFCYTFIICSVFVLLINTNFINLFQQFWFSSVVFLRQFALHILHFSFPHTWLLTFPPHSFSSVALPVCAPRSRPLFWGPHTIASRRGAIFFVLTQQNFISYCFDSFIFIFHTLSLRCCDCDAIMLLLLLLFSGTRRRTVVWVSSLRDVVCVVF